MCWNEGVGSSQPIKGLTHHLLWFLQELLPQEEHQLKILCLLKLGFQHIQEERNFNAKGERPKLIVSKQIGELRVYLADQLQQQTSVTSQNFDRAISINGL